MIIAHQSPPLEAADVVSLNFTASAGFWCTNASGTFFVSLNGVATDGGEESGEGGQSGATAPSATAGLEVGKNYTLAMGFGYTREGTNRGHCGLIDGEIQFEDVSSCYRLHLDPTSQTCVDGNRAWVLHDNYNPSNIVRWSVRVEKSLGGIEINACKIGGRATAMAGGSPITASLTHVDRLAGPITWSLSAVTNSSGEEGAVSTNLGCSLLPSDDTNCLSTGIQASNMTGTVTIRATDANGCYVEADLDLVDDSDGGCSSGGCGTGAEVGEGAGEPGEGQVTLGSVKVAINLGRASFGSSAGKLQLEETRPSARLYSPAGLQFRWKRPDVHVVRGTNGALRQVWAPQGLADIVSMTNGQGYWVKFYRPADVGIKRPSGFAISSGATPLVVWTFENPEPGTTNRLRVTRAPAGSASIVHEYTWTGSSWQLSSAEGMRIETQAVSWTTNANAVRTETIQISSAAEGVVSVRARKFEIFPFGERLVEDTRGTGEAAQTERYDFYTNGMQKSVVRADGSWQWYVYDKLGRPTRVFSPYGNQAPTTNLSLCRVLILDYSSNAVNQPELSGDTAVLKAGKPRRTLELVCGQPVRMEYDIYSADMHMNAKCLSTNAVWNDAANVVTLTTFYADGYFYGQVKSVIHPNGVMDWHEYYQSADYRYTTNIVSSGQHADETVTDGSRTVTVTDGVGRILARSAYDIVSGITNQWEVFSDFDDFGRARRVSYPLDGTYSHTDFSCCGEQTSTNREGTVTSHTLDGLKRRMTSVTSGIILSNVYRADGKVSALYRHGTNHTAILLEQRWYDNAGRQTKLVDAETNETRYYLSTNSNGSLVRTTVYLTNADTGFAVADTYNRDGTLQSTSGDGVHGVRFEYGTTTNGSYRKEIKLTGDGSDSGEWSAHYLDLAGREYLTLYPDNARATKSYDSAGRLSGTTDPDGVTILFAYNGLGQRELSGLDLDRNGALSGVNTSFYGLDRLTQTITSYRTNGGRFYRCVSTSVCPTNYSVVSTLTEETETKVDGRHTRHFENGVTNETWIVFHPSLAGARYETNVAPDGTRTLNTYQDGRLARSAVSHPALGVLRWTEYGYDAHGRRTSVVDSRNGTTSYGFDNLDRLTAVTTPAPAAGEAPQTTGYDYDRRGHVKRVTHPDNTFVTHEYAPAGELVKTAGSRRYPVEYAHDYAGRLKTMKTWQTYPTGGEAVTTWNYDGQRGWLTNKAFQGTNGPGYTYTPAGRLQSRTWARGITTIYTNTAAGEVAGIVYSDGTPGIAYEYDRLGRKTAVVDGAGRHVLAHDLSGRLVAETNTSGALAGVDLRNGYDALGRRTNATAGLHPGSASVSYGYDEASRLSNVAGGQQRAEYSYLANSSLVEQISFRDGGTTKMTSTWHYDALNRLTSVSTAAAGGEAVGSAYSYTSANQRNAVTNVDGSYWVYAYDSLGQVTSGRRHWADGSAIAGQQFEYGFDSIGNRKIAKSGGNAEGHKLRASSYSANDLNQYSSRLGSGYVNIIGSAASNAMVTVNRQQVQRHGDYFWGEVAVSNAAGPMCLALTNIGVVSQGTNEDIVATNVVCQRVAADPEIFAYDADGNLISDGLWTYDWDAENRLIHVMSREEVPDVAWTDLRFQYDWQGRRVSKTVSNWVAGEWALAASQRFVYDGWNLLAELNAMDNTVIRTYAWGTDASGSMQGAGGVGGLLWVTSTAASSTHFACYDGNHNVTALVNAGTGQVSARYEYGPFHELLRATGPMAKENVFLAATKYQDWETGLYYYGYRYYSPSTGRWLSRDLIGDEAFLMTYPAGASKSDVADLRRESLLPVYVLLGNDPSGANDGLGLAKIRYRPLDGCFGWFGVKGDS